MPTGVGLAQFSAMLVNDADYARVRDGDRGVIGTVTLDQIREVVR